MSTQTRNNEPSEVKEWGWVQQPACVPLSRKVFRKWLANHGVNHIEEDATLCFMELLTNAIRIPSPDGLTNSTWKLYENKLRVEVRDYSPEAPYVYPHNLEATSGRGLLLVHLLSDRWGYDHCAFLDGHGGYVAGKTVWFELAK